MSDTLKHPVEKALSEFPSAKNLPPFGALRAFDAVARFGGVRKAAQELGRDHAVISRHIRTLEAWTGAVLVERTPRGIVLTDDGWRYHQEISGAIDLIAGATIDLMKRYGNHPLQIWCMPGFALHWLMERLGAFENMNPSISIEVRPTEKGADLLAHEADIDIRFIANFEDYDGPPRGVRSKTLATVPIIGVASPGYIADMDPVRTPQDLLHHRLLHEDDFDDWQDWLTFNGVTVEGELPGPRLWQGHLTLDAARHGRGIALSNKLVANGDLSDNRLEEVGAHSEQFENKVLGNYLFMARSDRWSHPAIERFRKWLGRELTKSVAA